MKNPYDIIRTARITEKSTSLTELSNQYVFEVDPKATKQEIRNAVSSIFKKDVVSLNTMNVGGKKKRLRTAQFGRKRNWKKAIVRLKEGETIDLI